MGLLMKMNRWKHVSSSPCLSFNIYLRSSQISFVQILLLLLPLQPILDSPYYCSCYFHHSFSSSTQFVFLHKLSERRKGIMLFHSLLSVLALLTNLIISHRDLLPLSLSLSSFLLHWHPLLTNSTFIKIAFHFLSAISVLLPLSFSFLLFWHYVKNGWEVVNKFPFFNNVTLITQFPPFSLLRFSESRKEDVREREKEREWVTLRVRDGEKMRGKEVEWVSLFYTSPFVLSLEYQLKRVEEKEERSWNDGTGEEMLCYLIGWKITCDVAKGKSQGEALSPSL